MHKCLLCFGKNGQDTRQLKTPQYKVGGNYEQKENIAKVLNHQLLIPNQGLLMDDVEDRN
jgi:hypothetical protein